MSISPRGRGTFGDLLRPGDRVDVLLTRTKLGADAKVVTLPLLQNVLVLAVGRSFAPASEREHTRGSASVTLLLTVDQASLLAQARRDGALSLILRNEDDLEIDQAPPETDDSDVLEQEKRAHRQRRLPIERVD